MSQSHASSATRTQWVDISLRPVSYYRLDLAIVVLVLALASFAIANRAYWCQLQAYTVIVLLGATLLLFVRQYTEQLRQTASARNQAYCVDCKQESRLTLVLGSALHSQPSFYESLYPRPLDAWAAVALWAVWVCYGALFHDGRHVHDENALLGDSAFFGDQLPFLVRGARLAVLYLLSLQTFFRFQLRGVDVLVFLVLALLPGENSLPQSLAFGELLLRTMVFLVLFVSSEALERVRPYVAYLAAFDKHSSLPIVVLQMARRRAPRKSISGDMSAYLQAPGTAEIDCSGTAQERIEAETRHATDSVLARILSPVRASWVLIASPLAVCLALVQVLLVACVLMYNHRRAEQFVRGKSNLLRHRATNQPPPKQQSSARQGPLLPLTEKSTAKAEPPKLRPSGPLSPTAPPPPTTTTTTPTASPAPLTGSKLSSQTTKRRPKRARRAQEAAAATAAPPPPPPSRAPKRTARRSSKSKHKKSPDTSEEQSASAPRLPTGSLTGLKGLDQTPPSQLQRAVLIALGAQDSKSKTKEPKLQD